MPTASLPGLKMDESLAELSQAELDALSSVIGELNMLRANSSEQSSIATEDALRYLRAAKYNSSKAIEIYKNYQKHRDTHNLDDVKPYREPLKSEIASGKIQILGTSDAENSPILLFEGSKHDQKYSKLEAAMQLLFHMLDQIATNDNAQTNGIVFLLDLRDSSQDTKYLRSFLSVLLHGYPLHLKLVYIVGAPLWVKPILKTFKQLNKIKFVSLPDLLQHFTVDQLPSSLGGTLDMLTDHTPLVAPSATPTSPGSKDHAHSHSSRLPRQQSYQDGFANSVREERYKVEGGGERSALLVGNLVTQFDGRGRSHSGSSADRPHLRPLHPMLPPPRPSQPSTGAATKQKPGSPIPARRINRPPLPGSKPQSGGLPSPTGESSGLKSHSPRQKPQKPERPDDKTRYSPRVRPLKPPQVVGGNTVMKATPTSPSHSEATQKSFSTSVEPLAHAKESPSAALRQGNAGIASRIKNFEKQSDSHIHVPSLQNTPRAHSKSFDDDMGAQRRARAHRPSRALVPVQIGFGEGVKDRVDEPKRDREREREREEERRREKLKEDEGLRRKREEDMRRLRREEDRKQKDRREREKKQQASQPASSQPVKRPPPLSRSSVLDDYENVDLSPLSAKLMKGPPKVQPDKRKETPKASSREAPRLMGRDQPKKPPRDTAMGYENVAIHYVKSGSHSPEPPRMASGQARGGHKTSPQEVKEKGGVASSVQPAAKKRHDYENISILTPTGPIPYLQDTSSSEDSEDFSGDESPAPKEVIYENFGFEKGDLPMTADELESYLSQLEKKGISAEYLRIRNEPLAHPHTACKLRLNVPKNRYKDVVCYDNSRVVMETIPGVEGSDYIHANYVSSYKHHKAFILTQGPTKKTLVDFWRMVWEQKVHVIVMTTKCVELGRHKCTQYWPDEGVVQYGNVTVTVAKLQQFDGYDLRTIKTTCRGVERTIKHFQFLAWPDYGVPTSGSHVVDLIFAAREAQSRAVRESKSSSSSDLKIIVHCSAGVGRSGAFCVISNCMEEFKDKGVVKVQAAVRSLRLQRAYAIQTDEQYEFCYRTVLHYMRSPTHL